MLILFMYVCKLVFQKIYSCQIKLKAATNLHKAQVCIWKMFNHYSIVYYPIHKGHRVEDFRQQDFLIASVLLIDVRFQVWNCSANPQWQTIIRDTSIH